MEDTTLDLVEVTDDELDEVAGGAATILPCGGCVC